VAKGMKNEFGDAIDLNIYTNDSPEALNYQLKSATSVFVNGEAVPLDVAISNEQMIAYLREKM
jgi:hypothetical protein